MLLWNRIVQSANEKNCICLILLQTGLAILRKSDASMDLFTDDIWI